MVIVAPGGLVAAELRKQVSQRSGRCSAGRVRAAVVDRSRSQLAVTDEAQQIGEQRECSFDRLKRQLEQRRAVPGTVRNEQRQRLVQVELTGHLWRIKGRAGRSIHACSAGLTDRAGIIPIVARSLVKFATAVPSTSGRPDARS